MKEEKYCSACKTVKPLSSFHRNKSERDGLQAWCIQCRRVEYEKNKPAYFKRSAESDRLKRSLLLDLASRFLLGHPCSKCGEIGVGLPSLIPENGPTVAAWVHKRIGQAEFSAVLQNCTVSCSRCRELSRSSGWKELNKRKTEQLGMSPGKANHRLHKSILFDLLKRHKENLCFRCGKEISLEKELSVEHKEPWLGADPGLFWDLNNIAFSHLSCNIRARRQRPRRVFPHGTRMEYLYGCRCVECKKANAEYARTRRALKRSSQYSAGPVS